MKSRLMTVGCFLTAATLLGGSAFAFAPEFTDDLDTVIITDRTSQPTITDPFDDPDATGGWGGAFRTTSPFLFRYNDAVDLSTKVDTRDAASFADVKVLFTEYLDTTDTTPNSVKTLTINGKPAADNVPTDATDFQGTDAFDLSDTFLDFRNIDFSPGTGFGPFDPVGDLTLHSLELSGPSVSRVVTLHLGSDDFTVRGAASDRSFTVITQIDDIGDRLTTPLSTDPFDVNIYETGGNFDGWLISPITSDVTDLSSNGAQPAPGTPAPITGFATDTGVSLVQGTQPAVPNGLTSVTAQTNSGSNNNQRGLLGFVLPVNSGLDIDADSLYRARMNILSSNAATNASFFVQFGSVFTTGSTSTGFNDPGGLGLVDGTRIVPKISDSAFDLDAYLYSKGASVSPDGVVFNAFIVDTNTADGQEFTLNSVTVDKASGGRASLGAGNVIVNRGGPVTPDVANSPLPVEPGPTGFSEGLVAGQDFLPGAGGLNAAVPDNLTVTANQLTAQHGWASNAPTSGNYFEYTNFVMAADNTNNIDTYDSGITTDPTKLYVADMWASTDTPGAVTPNLGIFLTHDVTAFSAQNWNTGDTGLTASVPSLDPDPNTQLVANARMYSMLFSPHSPNATAETSGFVFFLWINAPQGTGNFDFGRLEQATIRVHRLIITEYDPF